jgi:uncharacterized protein
MKPPLAVLLVSLACALCAGSALASETAPEYPPHTIRGSEVRVLPVNAAGRHYQLSLGLPASYAKETARRYPVVYVTDGYWDFQKLDAIRGALVFDKVVPEFIIVGLGYAGEDLDYGTLRAWELSPVPLRGGSTTGHAAEFLATIESEIIPFVEREYRADRMTAWRHQGESGFSDGSVLMVVSFFSAGGRSGTCPRR